MASSEENNFEDSWRQAFENANELPPASVWEKVEARLNDKDDRVVIIPIWRRWQTLASVAAASIAIFLVLLGDGWLSQTTPALTKQGNGQALSNQKENLNAQTIQNKKRTPSSPLKIDKQPTISQPEKYTYLNSGRPKIAIIKNNPLSNALLTNKFLAKKGSSQKIKLATIEPMANTIANNASKNEPELSDENTFKANTLADLINDKNITLSTPFPALGSLEIKAMSDLIGPSKRQPWVAYQEMESEQKVPTVSLKQYWVSMDIMPASYNAGVAIGEVSRSGGTFGLAKQAALYNTVPSDASANRPSLSYAFQWHGGVQLGQRWSLETGLNYLKGNSIFEATNGFNVFTNSYINNLEAAISASDNSNPIYSLSSINSDKAQVQPLATAQNINNSYQFLQIPLQAGYALVKPKKKLSLWLLGGIINNVFLRNSFKSGQERTVIVSGNDSPYQKLSFSANTGIRFQYKLNKRWSSQLTGNYQLALGRTTKPEAVFEARPHLLGVGAGLRCGF